MTPTKTPFAGFERLAPGDPLSSDGYALQYLNPLIADKLAKIGAVTHRHDAHAAMPDPATGPTASVATTGGVIAANTAIHVTYTLYDAAAGETLPAPATVLSTSAGYLTPDAPPITSVDYSAGALLAGNPLYAITVTDGAGGETPLGPAASVTIDPGHASARVVLTGLTALTDTASGGSSSAGWRLWRSMDGGSDWDLLSTGLHSTDTFTDTGAGGNCTVSPPSIGTTVGTGALTVTVPAAGQPAAATFFSIYADTTGAFTAACLLGTYPVADFGAAKTYRALTAQNGQPPAVSQAYPGANQINPDTDILNWTWKRPVATVGALPTSSNTDGDARVTLDTDTIYVWHAATSAWVAASGGITLTESQHSASYTLTLPDAGTVVEFTSASAVNVTIPPNASVAFPVGTVIEVFQYGAGLVTVVAGAGVTLRSVSAHVNSAGQYATIGLRQRAANEWVISGNVA